MKPSRKVVVIASSICMLLALVVGTVYAAAYGVYADGYLPVMGLTVGGLNASGANNIRFADTASEYSGLKWEGRGKIEFNVSNPNANLADGIYFYGGNDGISFGTGDDNITFGSGNGYITYGAAEDAGLYYEESTNSLQLWTDDATTGGASVTVQDNGSVVITLGASS